MKRNELVWIIQKDMWDYEDLLINTVRNCGYNYLLIPFAELYKYNPTTSINPNTPTICHGSIPFVMSIGRLLSRKYCEPIYYCNLKDFECSNYYPHIREHRLQDNYLMLPFGELRKNPNCIIGHDRYFIRPNNGDKSFTGLVVDRTIDFNLEEWTCHISDRTIVVVSPYKNVVNEWRFVVGIRESNLEIFAGSQYIKEKDFFETSRYPEKAANIAIQASKQFLLVSQDPVWTVDIGELDNGDYKVVEFNSFSCAGLYCCNLDNVVEKVSEVAIKSWTNYIDGLIS